MSNEKTKPKTDAPKAESAVQSATPAASEHPVELHDQDLCAVQVMFENGVTENGKKYEQGDILLLNRGHALWQNKKHGEVYRIVRTVSYAKMKGEIYEAQPDDGRLKIS